MNEKEFLDGLKEDKWFNNPNELISNLKTDINKLSLDKDNFERNKKKYIYMKMCCYLS